MVSLPEHLMPVAVGKERVPREVIASEQRNRVLDAAVEVFAKRGYTATTVEHIVSAAKIGVGGFYGLFKGKEDCFLQAHDRITEVAAAELHAAAAAHAKWPEQACATLQRLLALVSGSPLQARIVLVESQTAGEQALERHEGLIDRCVPLMRRGREFSPFTADLPSVLEVASIGGLLWYLEQKVVQGDLDDLEAQLPEVAEIVIAPYIGPERTAELVKRAVSISTAA